MSQQDGVWVKAQQSPEFAKLRKSYRGFAFPLTAAFLSWYFLYILLTAFARDFVVTPVIGNINIAFILGVLQFVSTFVIMWLYERYSSKVLDEAGEKIRVQVDAELGK